LTEADDRRLGELAAWFTRDGLGEHRAPQHVIEQVAAIAGGPVEDFTGPHDSPMPIELWSWAMPDYVDASLPLADRLLRAITKYRRVLPSWSVTHARRNQTARSR